MYTEFEAKFLNNTELFCQKLQNLGATCQFERQFFKRKIYTASFLPEKSWIRVRNEGSKITLCIKKDLQKNDITRVQEYQTVVSDFNQICTFLEVIGCTQTMYCENYRTLWVYKNCFISIDTWPGLDPFIEVEGQSEQEVTGVAKELGLDFSTALFGTVFDVYKKVYGVSDHFLSSLSTITFDTITKERLEIASDNENNF